MSRDLWIFNGVDATTGEYLAPPMPREGGFQDLHLPPERDVTRAVMPGFDPRDLAQCGWGVIFPRGLDPRIHEALRPLLDHRRRQAAAVRAVRYQEMELRPGEDLDSFLVRHGRGPGPVHPDRIPYYLLLVGDPEGVPFRFQTQLDVQHAVGRLCFETVEEYARYAHSVVRAEHGDARRDPLLCFFGPRNPDDKATELSTEHLLGPLTQRMSEVASWQIRTTTGEDATKQALGEILRGERERPSLLFTASHGLGLPDGHPAQLERQGALLCQDWPGPRAWQGEIPSDWSFGASDLEGGEDVSGLVAFCFACHGAGTPGMDDFTHRNNWQPRQIAPRDFVARLPQRLLGHPRGGALAVIGHVERAWACSFLWRDAAQVDVFESTLKLLMDGWPVGAAMESFNQRYAELASLLAEALRRKSSGEPVDEREMSLLWTAHNDARGFVVLGDPAVRAPTRSPRAPTPASAPA